MSDERDVNGARRQLIRLIADSEDILKDAIESGMMMATPLTIPELILVTTYLIDGSGDMEEMPQTRAALFLTGKRLLEPLQAVLGIVGAGPPQDPQKN